MAEALEDIVARIAELKSLGYVPTIRKGPTGIGHTLERLLALTENNLIIPDLGEVELKATRRNTQSLITLFTYDRGVWTIPQRDLITRFGQSDEDRINLYSTISINPNPLGMRATVQTDTIELQGPGKEVLARWGFRDFQSRFHEKLRHLLLVQANAKFLNNIEHFHYVEAQFLSGWLFLWHIPRLFNEELILIDLRMHLKNQTVRNHGTAFRVREQDLREIYPLVEEMPV